ncbi:hypothetical protein HZU73_03596 [Apis mellifera caucasica]|uniref:Uncharacterized protein LOC107964981 n=1 Tax=Apis mellifera TaxID=7460 RepID=A0A7M7IJC4_APIME|nr:uncharacterized protein LOC107964981 [Apis mellifera]KAG6801474.1 hypothetical protein HZU73_03596 [Apis mellifera caucasica]KAG9431132.1 hypothetical protein HZU67_07107 [Apis mellifera carnica]|eukprot:XP_016769518.1 uncharacterized protein LOC107964981 [Apis mellifera]
MKNPKIREYKSSTRLKKFYNIIPSPFFEKKRKNNIDHPRMMDPTRRQNCPVIGAKWKVARSDFLEDPPEEGRRLIRGEQRSGRESWEEKRWSMVVQPNRPNKRAFPQSFTSRGPITIP